MDLTHMPLPTVAYLHSFPNVLWTTIPNEKLPQVDQLLFYAAHELACFLELTYIGPKEVLAASAETVFILREAVKCFAAMSQLPPGSVATVLLKIDRFLAGDDDGLSWKVP